MSCGVGGSRGSDLMLLCLLCRQTAVDSVQPPARELPYAASAALKREKKKRKKKKEKKYINKIKKETKTVYI